MNDYNKNYFWTTRDALSNEVHFFFKINGELVEVSKEVYRTCVNSYTRILANNRRNELVKMQSLDYVSKDGICFGDTIASNNNVETEVITKILLERLRTEISRLPFKDRQLLTLLLYGNYTEEEIGSLLGISQQAVNKRKKRIIDKLRKKIL